MAAYHQPSREFPGMTLDSHFIKCILQQLPSFLQILQQIKPIFDVNSSERDFPDSRQGYERQGGKLGHCW